MKRGLIAFMLFLALVAPLFFRGGHVIAEEGSISYDLPFPGILPDHPLYPLKTLRDRILEVLIRDQERKVEFYLLMADKRLNMGIMLSDSGKHKLAESTIANGEQFFLKGVEAMRESEVSNRDYNVAVLKHKEVVKELRDNVPENYKKGYSDSMKILDEVQIKLDGS